MNSYVKIFHNARKCLPCLQIQLAVNRLLIVSTDVLPVIFTAGALSSFIHEFPITQNFQLRIYNDVYKEITITELYYIPLVKALMSNNRQTCPSVLGDLRGTLRRELSVIYLIDFILLSHLQLIRPLYELFLEIIKAHGTS